MSTKKQKFVYIFALVLSFALGMLTMSGCAYFSQEKIAGTVSTVLEIAYVAGGATHVEHLPTLAAVAALRPSLPPARFRA